VPYLACTSTDGFITCWVYKDPGWYQIGGQARGSDPIIKITNSGIIYLAFIDDNGRASLYKYAYLGKTEQNLPYYAWIGGAVHPNTDGLLDLDVDLHIDKDRIYLAYTNAVETKVTGFMDPLSGITWTTGGNLFIDRLSTSYDMQCLVNGQPYSWDYEAGHRIQVSDPAVLTNPGTEIIITLVNTEQAIRITPFAGMTILTGRVTGSDSQPLAGVNVRVFNTPDGGIFPPEFETATDTEGVFRIPEQLIDNLPNYRVTFTKSELAMVELDSFTGEVAMNSADTEYLGTIAYSGSGSMVTGNSFRLNANEPLSDASWLEIFNTIKSHTASSGGAWINGIAPDFLGCEISYDGSFLRLINNSTDTAYIYANNFAFPFEQIYDWAGNHPTVTVNVALP